MTAKVINLGKTCMKSLVTLYLCLTFLSVPFLRAHAKAQIEPPSCTLQPAFTGTIKNFTPAHTIILNDGRHLKLANIKLASAISSDQLEKHLKGKNIIYYASGRTTDRHNRFLAHIMVHDGPTNKWLQDDLVKQGQAIPFATTHNYRCMKELLKSEKQAKTKSLGEWADGKGFKVYNADDVSLLNQEPQGKFIIVSGKVHKVARFGKNTFINFSADWRKDFTILIETRLLNRKTMTWPNLKKLIGQRVQVRGWLDHWNGPMIRLEIPSMFQTNP